MDKYIRNHSELPVDAPLSATDGFLWSRLESPQSVDELTRTTGLPTDAVKASLRTLLSAGLLRELGEAQPDSQSKAPTPHHPKPQSKDFSYLVTVGHQILDSVPVSSHWPELMVSRDKAFDSFRAISKAWLGRFKSARGKDRLNGEKLLSRLRRLRDSAPHQGAEKDVGRCIWVLDDESFSRLALGLAPSEAKVHPGVAGGAPRVVSAQTGARPKLEKASGRTVPETKRTSMDERRAEIEARRRENMKQPTHPSPASSGVSSGAHRVAGLDAHALYQKAVTAFNQGLLEESARAIQLALAMTPDDPKLQALDAEVSSEWKRQRAHKLAKQAANDWTVGLIEPALHKIIEAAELVPDYASIAAQAADYCLLTGKIELAVEFADRAVVNAPSRLDYRLTAAAAFCAAGDALVAKEQLSIIREQIKELESRPDD